MRNLTFLLAFAVLILPSSAARLLQKNQNMLKLIRHKGSSNLHFRGYGANRSYFSKISSKKSKESSLETNKISAVRRRDIIEDFDGTYVTNITIGTPPQNFTVLVESGNSLFFVPSEKCDSYACERHRRYNSANSTSYKKDGGEFGWDGVSGYLSFDHVCIDDICAENQPLGEATYEDWTFNENPWDAQLGIGFGESKEMKIPPFFSTLVKQKKVEQPLFGIWLNKSQGELSLGGVDSKRFASSISWHPVISYPPTGDWAFKIDEVSFSSLPQPVIRNTFALIDINLNEIWAPIEETEVLFKELGKFEKYDDYWVTYYTNDCTPEYVASLPEIYFNLNGKKYGLSAHEYMLAEYEKQYCESRILGLPNSRGYWRLGEPITFKYYMAFDYAQNLIGLTENKKY